MERADLTGLVAHEEGEESSLRAMLPIPVRKDRLGIDRDARPPEMMLEVVRRTGLLPAIGSNIEEEPIAPVVEEVADDQLFVELGVELALLQDLVPRRVALGR